MEYDGVSFETRRVWKLSFGKPVEAKGQGVSAINPGLEALKNGG